MGWSLCRRKDDLWARLIRGKYGCGDNMIPSIRRRPAKSNLWRGVHTIWENVHDNLIWRLGNVSKIHFWTDRWLPQGRVLLNQALVGNSDISLDHTIKEFLTPSGGWDVDRLQSLLPTIIVNRILALHPLS